MASAIAGSVLMPRDITKTGKLADDLWLIGTVVRVREMKRQDWSETGKGGGATETGTGKKRGKGSAKKGKT